MYNGYIHVNDTTSSTVKPLNNGHIGMLRVVLYIEVSFVERLVPNHAILKEHINFATKIDSHDACQYHHWDGK